VITIPVERKGFILLCPKCHGKAGWDKNGDLQCLNPDCGYLYYMFSDKDNSFQKELF